MGESEIHDGSTIPVMHDRIISTSEHNVKKYHTQSAGIPPQKKAGSGQNGVRIRELQVGLPFRQSLKTRNLGEYGFLWIPACRSLHSIGMYK